jgi:hypothetical protein
MNDTVVAIVSAFFVIGILVGVIVVIAMSVLQAERRGASEDPLDFGPRGPRQPPGLPRDDDTRQDGYSRWPGDADNDFSDR